MSGVRVRTCAWALLGLALVVGWTAVDSRSRTLLANTLWLIGGTLAISLPLGTMLGWLLVRTDLPGRRAGLLMLGLMLFVPLYLQAAAWQAGFGLQGWYTLTCRGPLFLDGWAGAIWVHGVQAVPWVVLIVGGGLWLVEPELEEQAALDAPAATVLLRVTLRSGLGAILVAALWVSISVAGEMAATDLFAVRTYAEEIYTTLTIGPQPGDPPLGAAPGFLLTLGLVAAGLALTARLIARERPPSVRRRWVFRLGPARWPAAIAAAVVMLGLTGVPLANLLYQAGVSVRQTETGRIRAWSPGKAARVVLHSPASYREEYRHSLRLGLLAATTAVAVAAGAAWRGRGGGWRSGTAMALAAAGLAVPGPLIGLAVIWLLNRPEFPWLAAYYNRTILAPWVAMAFRGMPPALLILWHAFRTIPATILDAAAVDGAGSLSRFWRIAVPTRLTALAVAWLVAFAVALGDLAASILVVPPGVSTLSIQIFNLLHYGVQDQVAGISLALIAFFAAIAAVAGWAFRGFVVVKRQL